MAAFLFNCLSASAAQPAIEIDVLRGSCDDNALRYAADLMHLRITPDHGNKVVWRQYSKAVDAQRHRARNIYCKVSLDRQTAVR